MSYTQANEEGPSWMDRLPRIQTRSKSSMSLRRPDDTESSLDEKGEFPAGVAPGNFLRRQREDDDSVSVQPSRRKNRRSKHGGPVSQSAIAPQRHNVDKGENEDDRPGIGPRADSEAEAEKPMRRPMAAGNEEMDSPDEEGEQEGEVYEEGDKTVYEDEEGNVLAVENTKPGQSASRRESFERTEGHRLMKEHDVHHGVAYDQDNPHEDEGPKVAKEAEDAGGKVTHAIEHPQQEWRRMMKGLGNLRKHEDNENAPKKERPTAVRQETRRGPARAYQFGNTIIVEDEDGEVLKKYDISAPPKKPKAEGAATDSPTTRQRIQRMGTFGLAGHKPQGNTEAGPSNSEKTPAESANKKKQRKEEEEADDARLRFTVGAGGRRMSKAEFIRQISALDPKARAKFVEQSDVPQDMKDEAHEDVSANRRPSAQRLESRVNRGMPELQDMRSMPESREPTGSDNAALKRVDTDSSDTAGPEGLALVDSNDRRIPFHDVRDDLRDRETAAERRRREARTRQQPAPQRRQSSPPPRPQEPEAEDSEDDGTPRLPPAHAVPAQRSTGATIPSGRLQPDNEGETAAERRRREGALGVSKEESDSEEDEAPRQAPQSIRFAEPQRPEPTAERGGAGTGKLRWGANRGR